MLQAISQTDTVPVVRVPWNEPATIMKALDLGAYGIIVPLVNTAEDAAKAVAACRYPPVGMRSSGPVRAVHYGGADYVANANDEIVIMAMIETKEGLANLDAICATPGLDAVYIGPADLSFALGHGAPRRQSGPAAHRHLRQDPRGGAQARHQGGHALRERGVRAGAVKRGFDMVMLTSDLASMVAGARRSSTSSRPRPPEAGGIVPETSPAVSLSAIASGREEDRTNGWCRILRAPDRVPR